jgi:hypothetical protein
MRLNNRGARRKDSGDPTRALEYAEAAAALDASDERPVQIAMEAEATTGIAKPSSNDTSTFEDNQTSGLAFSLLP